MPNPSWKPGVSGNPKGRPPVKLSLGTAIRQHLPPDKVVEIVMTLLASSNEEMVFKALSFAAAYGYAKPPTTSEVTVHEGNEGAARLDLSEMPEAKRRAMLQAVEEAERLASEAEPDAGGVTEH